uniref:hypothetical protein n=1 Tax=Actinomadura fibrosa TaxID=111802 RepID=UPI001A95472E
MTTSQRHYADARPAAPPSEAGPGGANGISRRRILSGTAAAGAATLLHVLGPGGALGRGLGPVVGV